MADVSVPAQFVRYSKQLDEIAVVLRSYIDTQPTWSASSPAIAEVADQTQFEKLAMIDPVIHALLQPITALSQAHDHLVAFAATMRAERTVLALMTLLRPIMVASGMATYVADPNCDVRERVRRSVNIDLKSMAEKIQFFESSPDEAAKEADRRTKLASSARSYWTVDMRPAGRKGRIPDWKAGEESLGDMGYVRVALGVVAAEDLANAIYRLVSASTHAQPHAVLSVLDTSTAERAGPGYSVATIRLTHDLMLLLLLSAGTALWNAVMRCARLFGWNIAQWDADARPHILGWNRSLATLKNEDFVSPSGLWLPPGL